MAPDLRTRRQSSVCRRGDLNAEQGRGCPVCMEPTKDDWFAFPCGHSICTECNDKMLARRFLSCPTCRTPREGVSQHQVDAANRSRAQEDDEASPVVRLASTIFFPDESGGANPFGPLAQAMGSPISAPSDFQQVPEDDDEALAQVMQAQEVVGGHLPLTRTISVQDAVHGPMRELVNRLLSPSPISEFLAQRALVRRHQQRERLRSMHNIP